VLRPLSLCTKPRFDGPAQASGHEEEGAEVGATPPEQGELRAGVSGWLVRNTQNLCRAGRIVRLHVDADAMHAMLAADRAFRPRASLEPHQDGAVRANRVKVNVRDTFVVAPSADPRVRARRTLTVKREQVQKVRSVSVVEGG